MKRDLTAGIGYQPGASARNNVTTYLAEHARSFPGRPALRWVEEAARRAWDGDYATPLTAVEIGFGELERRIAATAAGLAGLGLGRGDRAVLLLPMSPPMYVAMFAAQRLGAIPVFLDSWARREHLAVVGECVAPKAMISLSAAFELVRPLAAFAGLELAIIAGAEGGAPGGAVAGSGFLAAARLEELMAGGGVAPVCPVASEDTALVTFTTGSSGTPKGADRSHRFLAAQHAALSAVLPYRAEDRDLPAFPIFSLNNLASGVNTVLPAVDLASPSPRDVAALVSQLLHDGVTCATLAPWMFARVGAFCRERGLELPGLRRVVTGGAPVSRDEVARFAAAAPNARVVVLYGSTEVEPIAHIEAAEMLARAPDPDPEIVEEGVNVGRIVPELTARFLRLVREPVELGPEGWEGLEVVAGEVGELAVAGEHVCRGYYNNREAFRATKIRDHDGRVWHRTGDLARRDEAGDLWLVGRVHNAIERGGRYCFPVRPEILLKRLPFVAKAAFLGLPDPHLGEAAAAVLVPAADSDGDPATDEHVVSEVRRLLAKNSIPLDRLYRAADIPMDPRHHSKVEYEVLRRALLAGDGELLWQRQGGEAG